MIKPDNCRNRFVTIFAICILAVCLIVPISNSVVSAGTVINSTVPLPSGKVLYYPFDELTTAYFTSYNYFDGNYHKGGFAYSIDFKLHASYGEKPEDLSFENNAYIYPIANGKVIKAWKSPSLGNVVYISHEGSLGKEFISIYAHMQDGLAVGEGDQVSVNSRLGIQGHEGVGVPVPNTHLHLSLVYCAPPLPLEEAFQGAGGRCSPVRIEPLVGQNIDERFNWWPRYPVVTRGIGTYHTNENREISPSWLSDITPPEIGWWNPATTQVNSLSNPLNPDQPIIFDVHFGDNQSGIGEIRLTANYSGWYDNPDGAWRIIARCRPDNNSECQNGNWHKVWDWAHETKGNYTSTPLEIPWMNGINPRTLKDSGLKPICISFDIFDKAGNARYAPQGTQCNQLSILQSEVIHLNADETARLIYVDSGQSTSTTDAVEFVTDITLNDGTIVSPNMALSKIWRLKNSGTTSWDNGYKLVFVSGEQMGAPSETDVPATAPNQTVDLSVPITAPTASGEHTGYFQLRNPQGTYFGPKIWVKINVRSASSKIAVLSADPPSPADTQTVRISAKVEGMSNLRAMRLKVDGQVQGEFAGPESTFTWNTNGFSAGAHSVVIEAADQTDTSWSHPEVRSISYTLLGTSASPNLKPNAPTLTSPYDWFVYYSGNTAQLCVQANGDPDGDTISAFYFDVYDSAQLWNSGWTANNCVTTGALGPYNYKWHVKVRDSRGAESDWSADRNFTLVNPNLSITDLSFQPQDGNSEVVKIRACTAGQGGIGITMRVDVNDANDGSANGQWHRIKELSVPCFNDIDAPLWQTLESGGNYEDGPHLVRVEAHGLNTGWNGAAVREAVYTLPHRRPSGFSLVAPVSSSGNLQDPVFLASPTVTFQWEPALRANSYTLSVGVNPNPAGDASPVYRQTFTAGVTQQTVTFGQNYSVLYWQVRATNEMGSTDTGGQLIGIDQTEPTCSIQSLPSVSYENNFQVNWSGADNPAGIRAYDIQYLDSERGSWNDWLTAVPNGKTYELFSGQAGHSYSFRCRAMDHAGNMGSYPTSGIPTINVDPAGRPPEPWWGSDYATKRSITIQNNMAGVALPTYYPVKVYFTSGTTPSAADVYNASLSAKKCDDLRIVYNNSTELNRYIKKCDSDGIEIWFRIMTSIPAGSTDVTYQMYIGNPGAVNPPEDPAQIWYPSREGDTTNLYLFQEGNGSTATDFSGNSRNCSINPSVQWSAGKWGSGLYFNRANNGGTISLTCGSPYPIYSLTAEMWFKSDSSFYNSDGRIAGQLGPNGQLSWLFSIESSTLKFERWCNGGSQQARGTINLHTEPFLSQWNHIAVTFDGGNQVKFYVNGILDNSVVLWDSCSSTYNVPLEIGSVEGSGQGQYTIGAFKLSNTVKTNFYPGSFANITNEPTSAVGLVNLPPVTGFADLAVESLSSYPNPSGGVLVEAVVKNNGTVSAVNGFYTDLYLDHLPTGINDFTDSLKFWVNDPIPAGGTAKLTTVISDLNQLGLTSLLPGEEKSGTLYAQTDSTGALNETDKVNNIFSNGVEVCTAAGDIYEGGDGTSLGANWLASVQTHNFDRPGDEDWMKLAAKQGQVYRIVTSSLGPNADTYLYLFDQDGTTLLASNDDSDGSLASKIEWVAPADGTYYILVKHWNPSSGGCGTSYSIRLEEGVGGNSTYLPIIIR